jgi:hypothetical protein
LQYEQIVAARFLSQSALSTLGPALDSAWPVEEVPTFADLLRAIDAADRRSKDKDTAH